DADDATSQPLLSPPTSPWHTAGPSPAGDTALFPLLHAPHTRPGSCPPETAAGRELPHFGVWSLEFGLPRFLPVLFPFPLSLVPPLPHCVSVSLAQRVVKVRTLALPLPASSPQQTPIIGSAAPSPGH